MRLALDLPGTVRARVRARGRVRVRARVSVKTCPALRR